jgi:hypothetical protein
MIPNQILCLALFLQTPLASPQVELGSYLGQPAFELDDIVRGPVDVYQPQPGDIFLATDQAKWAILGHFLCGGAGVHHSGIVFQRPDGRMGLVEAGPFNKTMIEVMDPFEHMNGHIAKNDRVWIRRRAVPLTPEQSARLTRFICGQEGKPFATLRMLAQVTPIRTRGILRTPFLGKPHGGTRSRYFCSELVTESCVASGLMDGETARPSATLPRDLFFGHSTNPWLDRHLNMNDAWFPPARWLPGVPVPYAPPEQIARSNPSPASETR